MKNLIVNADDLGWTAGVNRGIAQAHRNGIVTSSSLLANGGAFEDGVRVARALPALGIGRFLRFYQRFRKHLHAVELFSGALLLCVGGLIFVNRLTWMAGKLGFLNTIVLWLERSLTGAK